MTRDEALALSPGDLVLIGNYITDSAPKDIRESTGKIYTVCYVDPGLSHVAIMVEELPYCFYPEEIESVLFSN